MAIAYLTGCHHGSIQTPESRGEVKVYPVRTLPATYGSERVVGGGFLNLGFRATLHGDTGKFALAFGDRSAEFPLANGRAVAPIRLRGPAGMIEREFVVATGYDGPISISPQDAQDLGIRDAGADVVLAAREGGARQTRKEASVRAEIPRLGFSNDVLVTWPAPPGAPTDGPANPATGR